jgi:hypothetical protein
MNKKVDWDGCKDVDAINHSVVLNTPTQATSSITPSCHPFC